MDAAYEIVEDIGEEPFTKPDLAERLRQKGYEIERPKNGLYATQRVLADGIIKRIQQGGGNRADVYQRVKGSRAEEGSRSTEHTEGKDIGISASVIPRQLCLNNGMERGEVSHKIIDALRRNEEVLLNRYDDLYIKAFTQLKQDQLLGSLDVMKRQMIRAQENQLGIDLSTATDRSTPLSPDRTAEELAAKVLGSSSALPDVLS